MTVMAMTTVPQKTLDWLYRVLTSNSYDPNQAYHDPTRTYSDVAHLLTQYSDFSPRTDVYTFENGASALLLHLSGTLPVTFRGVVYRFPVALWIPNTYPDAPPIVYVTPTQDMMVRPGQHVSGDGKVYHHYLAHWREARDRSTIVDFLSILRDIFTKEPPVLSKQADNARPPPPPLQQSTPPTVPPLPQELVKPQSQPPPNEQGPPIPPQLPPKPEVAKPQEGERPSSNDKYNKPPPLPPVPVELHQPQADARIQNVRGDQFLPKRSSSLRKEVTTQPQHPQNLPPQSYVQDPRNQGMSATHGPSTVPQFTESSHRQLPYQMSHYTQPDISPYPQNVPPPPPRQPHGSYPQHDPARGPHPGVHEMPPAMREPDQTKSSAPDLLTSPFDLELPAQGTSSTPPPIPPNPEKDVLLQTLSRTLTQTLRSNIDQTNSGLQPLHSQSNALHSAIATLRSEITSLNTFHANLQSNTSILQQSLHHADNVIADAKARLSSNSSQPSTDPSTNAATGTSAGQTAPGLPAIDEVLVAPTVVGKQIYDLVTDERGIQRAVYALQSGLVKGRVGVDTWAKLTRSLAREAFLKKALIRKASKGMGLTMEG